MEILKELELVDVRYEDKKAILTFLDEEHQEIREVNFNKQIYKDGKFIDDPEKDQKVEELCQEHFGTSFSELSSKVGTKKDIYVYDRFNSLYEINIVEKFSLEEIGTIFETEIESIEDDGISLLIKFKYDDKIYQSKMGYAVYLETKKEWFVNPQKRAQKIEKFKEKFGVSFDDKDQLIGKKIMVEIKGAFGTHTYAEIKPFPKKKK